MIDPESIERHREAHRRLSLLVTAELEKFFRRLNLSRPESARDALLAYIPALITKYGPVSEQLALEWYEQLRFQSGALGSFRAVAPPVDMMDDLVEAATGSVRYAAGHLFPDNPKSEYDPEMTLSVLKVKMSKYVREPGRQTMIYNATNEGVYWARVPTGAETCSFCLVLASRGAAYITEQSAGSKEYGEENLFHGECDCEVIRVGLDEEYPEGYLPDDIYRMYDKSAEVVGGARNNLEAILYDFRRRFPELVKDGVYDDEYLTRIG